MTNNRDISFLSTGKIIKLILLSPFIGGILSSIIFNSYLIYTLIKEDVYNLSGLGGFGIAFIKLMPLMCIISFIISYLVGFLLLVPTFLIKKKFELSDNIFWIINGLFGTVLGVIVGYSYSHVNAVLVFVVFVSIFSCSLFNASLLTSSINMMRKNKERLEKIKEETPKDFVAEK